MRHGGICKRRSRCGPFPFSDLTNAKRRPALIVSRLEGDDAILCQITSQTINDKYSIQLDKTHFESGGLNQSSNVRPNRVFTADTGIILYKIGKLTNQKLAEITEKLIEIIRN